MATAELDGPRLRFFSEIAPIFAGAFMRRPIDPLLGLSIAGVAPRSAIGVPTQ